MNKVQQFIVKSLGLQPGVTAVTKATGIQQGNRPAQRSSSLIGQAIAPNRKVDDYLNSYMGWVYSCVNVLAQETSDIDLTLYRRTKQNEFEVVDNHPVLDLIYKVNPLYTSYLLWEATAAYLKLTGEAFWYLVGPVPNPKEIWVLRPDWITVNDSPSKLIASYSYGPDKAHQITIPFEQIIAFKDFNPKNPFRGYGAVRAGAKSIDENEFQQDYSRQFFYNSAMPAGALETDQNLTDDKYERIRSNWEAVHRGSKNAWKVAILEAGLKWNDIGMSRRDMDFIEGRKLTRDEVLAIFRVPKPLLTFDDVNRAAAKEARAILLENVISHDMKRMVSFLNEFLLPRYGDDDLFFDNKNPVPNDQAADVNYYKAGLGNAPWLTVNEVRERENLPAIDGGDQLMQPFSLAPLGTQTPEEKAEQKRLKKTSFNVRIPQYPYFRHQMDALAKKLEDTAYRLLSKMVSRKTVEAENGRLKGEKFIEGEVIKDVADRDVHSKTVITRTEPRETQLRHVLASLFADQQQKVNAFVDQGVVRSAEKLGEQKAASTVSEIAASVVSDTDVFAQSIMPVIRDIINAEGIAQIQSLVDNAVFYMQTPEIQRFIKKDGVKFIQAVNQETASQLQDELVEAIGKQESIPQIKARVQKVFEDANGFRAERIARSEVMRATNFSTQQAYKQSGVVESKEWLTAHDERTCPWCGPLDGKQLGLNDDFFEQGDTVTGVNDKGKKVYLNIGVDDVGFPPLHPNCRCTLIPVLKESDKSVRSKDELMSELTDATIKQIKKVAAN